MKNLVNDEKNCCGCTACKHICPTHAISMEKNEKGFLYPNIDSDKCIDCNLCKKVCLFNGKYERHTFDQKIYAVRHKDNDVLFNSSSGGAFTAISDYILEKNGVVYGVMFDEDLNVKHSRAVNKSERDNFRGSKYSQSDLGGVFLQVKDDLEKDRYVLFSGTPCQTAGLNSFLKNTGTNAEKLVLCDLVCHGTPSPLIWKEYINFCERKNKSKIIEYHHRSKIDGWQHRESALYNNGKEDSFSDLSQSYKWIFYSNSNLRESCYNCVYTNFMRPSDITIGDFWGIEKCMKDFYDRKGVSLVLVNSEKGNFVFQNIKDNIYYRESSREDCLQAQLQHPAKRGGMDFWSDYEKHGFKYILKKYGGYSILRRIGRRIKPTKLLYSKILKCFRKIN